jgi:hypothetical protein
MCKVHWRVANKTVVFKAVVWEIEKVAPDT